MTASALYSWSFLGVVHYLQKKEFLEKPMAIDIATVIEQEAPFIPSDPGVTSSDVPRVQLIFVAQAPGAPMRYLPEAVVLAHQGLLSDRHRLVPGVAVDPSDALLSKLGTVSAIAREDINFANGNRIANGLKPILPKETRRNFITIRLDPKKVIRKVVKVGSGNTATYFYGLETLKACDRPSRLVKKTAFKMFFQGIAGVKLIPLTNGMVRVDDIIEITDLPPTMFHQ